MRRSAKKKKEREHGEGELRSYDPPTMVVPWTGLDALLQQDGPAIVWEDFEHIVFRVRETHKAGYACMMYEGLGQEVEEAAKPGRWRRATFAVDTPPRSKAVGLVLARAVNGMIVEGGWNADLSQAECALRQTRNACLSLKPQLLPAAWKCTFVGSRYKSLVLGDWSNLQYSERPLTVAAHRLVCWLANGTPEPDQECMHICHRRPWCCNPSHLIWGTHQEYCASPQPNRKPPR